MPKKLNREDVASKATMSFRPSPWLREQIEIAAARSGRSLSQEAEWRLEQHVRAEAQSPMLRAFLEAAPKTVSGIEAANKATMIDDAKTRAACNAAVKVLSDVMIGLSASEPAWRTADEYTPKVQGELVAAFVVDQWAKEVSQKLKSQEKWKVVQRDAVEFKFHNIDQEYPPDQNATSQAKNSRRRLIAQAVRDVYYDECQDDDDNKVLTYAANKLGLIINAPKPDRFALKLSGQKPKS